MPTTRWVKRYTPFEEDHLHFERYVEPGTYDYLLNEDGTHLLLETGFRIII